MRVKNQSVKPINRPLLQTRIRRLKLFCEVVPEAREVTTTAAWLVMQSCAGSEWTAFVWIIKHWSQSKRMALSYWWNIEVMKRAPEDWL